MLKVGDTVRLISGSPLMTVARIIEKPMSGDSGYLCIWFVDDKPIEHVFAFNTLSKV